MEKYREKPSNLKDMFVKYKYYFIVNNILEENMTSRIIYM